MARSRGRLRDHPWAENVEAVQGDVSDADSFAAAAMRDVHVPCYLVHSLDSGTGL
ncbi:hypothetical protein ACWGQ9_25765 [Streptomyces parvus]